MKKYHIYGRSGAGSLIVEFLFEETNTDYSISFPSKEEMITRKFLKINPLGKIPILITPSGSTIFESLAIINHITERNPILLPKPNSSFRDKYWQILAILASVMYPAYHRQHHSYQYIDEKGFETIRKKSQMLQSNIYDYFEKILNPYFCDSEITAVDFYFYMMSRWDLNKNKMRNNRPKLTNFLEIMRSRNSVDKILKSQPKYVVK